MMDNDFRNLIRRFYELQAERVETYRMFEEGHQAYLKSGPHYDFVRYRQLVHEITLAFNGISKEVIQIKDRFREVYDRSDLSEHLEKIQEMEKEKLELTARLQIAKQNAQDHPSQELHQEEMQILKHKIIKSVEAISEVLQDFKYDCEEIQ
ncbi:required for excision 1-B domain-containing protein isoform X1 [Xenopus laevis]|uniref:Required for excision 1-B domain-containing protein isoform X1 n=2 Tax=Xenopus laevis TaxID=8355 RepID=A0A8J0US17_XENLA|nr:required for excision 1-B domain-containing protein isoform X1 [Xenopus laevis]